MKVPSFLPLLMLFFAAASAVPAGQEQGGPSDGTAGGPPPLVSPWRSWQFSAPPERVREELQAILQADGLVIQSEDRKEGAFRTGVVEFDDKKFGVEVSIPPPKASPKYPYFQPNSMTSGRFSLEGRLTPAGSSATRVELRAGLEIRALDKRENVMRWVPRYSNGEVESHYFTRLSLRLLNPPKTAMSPR